MTSLSEMLTNCRRVIQKALSKSSDQRTDEKEISDPGIRDALRQTLIGFSLHPEVLKKK